MCCNKTPVRKRPTRLIYSNTYLHTDHVFSFIKGRSLGQGTMTGTIPFVPSATYNAPANSCRCSQFPPAFVGRAARPRAPTSPAMLTLERRALPKLGEAGGSPRSFAASGKTAGRPRQWRVRCAPRPSVSGARPGARGWPAEPTPSHSRAAGAALLALGCRQMRGGGQAQVLKRMTLGSHERSLALPGTRMREC